MNCSNCGKEMESGYLCSAALIWTPKADKVTLIPGKNDVLVKSVPMLENNNLPAYICPTCRKVLIEY